MLMSSEKGLSSGENVPDNNCRTKRIYDMLIVRMQKKAVVNVSWVV